MSQETNDVAPETGDDRQENVSALQQLRKDIIDPFRSLLTSPRALWGVYISYLLEGLVYFGILTILGKYLSENVGLTDLHAGWVYSGFTSGITLAMLFLGGVADKIGVRKALLFSLGVMVVGRFLLAASGTFFPQGGGAGSAMFFLVVAGLLIVVIGYGTYQPAAYSAIKRFTNKDTAAMGYAMIYGLMNLGAFFSGIISPPIRKSLGIEAVFWVYTVLTLAAFLTVLFVMTRRVVERDTLTPIDVEEKDAGESAEKRSLPRLRSPGFYAMIGVLVAALGALLVMIFTTQPLPAQRVVREARFRLRHADPAAMTTAAQWRRLAATLDSLAAGIVVPDNPGDRYVVDTGTFRWARRRLAEDARFVDSFAALADGTSPLHLDEEQGRRVAHQVKTLGLAFYMGAYGLVSDTDAAVLERLRLRIKDPRAKEPDPLSAAERRALLALGHRSPDSLAVDLAAWTDAARRAITAVHPGFGAAFGTVLVHERSLLDAVRELGAGDEKGRKRLMDHLLEATSMFTRSYPAVVADATGFQEEQAGWLTRLWLRVTGAEREAAAREPRSIAPADIFATWQTNELAQLGKLDKSLGRAVAQRSTLAFLHWLRRYGIWLLFAVVDLLLLGRYILRRRPEHPFHDKRFVFFIFILIPVQTLFAHNWLTLPYYINRAFGGTTVGENFEFFSNLNPILIFFLAPMVAAVTARAKVYPMMIWGTFVMAAPTLLLVLPPQPALLLAYILLMSVGEAMWQPRFLQWIAEIAPEGQTGAYMGIGQFPWFLTKFVTGLYSGWFLQQYCPMVGPQNTQFMWLIYSLIALTSPVALWLARGWMMSGMRQARR